MYKKVMQVLVISGCTIVGGSDWCVAKQACANCNWDFRCGQIDVGAECFGGDSGLLWIDGPDCSSVGGVFVNLLPAEEQKLFSRPECKFGASKMKRK